VSGFRRRVFKKTSVPFDCYEADGKNKRGTEYHDIKASDHLLCPLCRGSLLSGRLLRYKGDSHVRWRLPICTDCVRKYGAPVRVEYCRLCQERPKRKSITMEITSYICGDCKRADGWRCSNCGDDKPSTNHLCIACDRLKHRHKRGDSELSLEKRAERVRRCREISQKVEDLIEARKSNEYIARICKLRLKTVEHWRASLESEGVIKVNAILGCHPRQTNKKALCHRYKEIAALVSREGDRFPPCSDERIHAVAKQVSEVPSIVFSIAKRAGLRAPQETLGLSHRDKLKERLYNSAFDMLKEGVLAAEVMKKTKISLDRLRHVARKRQFRIIAGRLIPKLVWRGSAPPPFRPSPEAHIPTNFMPPSTDKTASFTEP